MIAIARVHQPNYLSWAYKYYDVTRVFSNLAIISRRIVASREWPCDLKPN